MNKKVCIASLVLIVCALLSIYIVKCFFPMDFALATGAEQMIAIGSFIDGHWYLYFLFTLATGLLTDYLYFGAVCKTYKLSWKLWIVMLVYNIGLTALYTFAGALIGEYSYLILAGSVVYMIFTPMFFTQDIKALAITYSVNYIGQALTLSIRNIGALMTTFNSLSTFIISIDCYLWLALLFVLFNFHFKKREENKNGNY